MEPHVCMNICYRDDPYYINEDSGQSDMERYHMRFLLNIQSKCLI